MFGPEGFGGISGSDGEITGLGNAKVAIIARWQARRSGSYPDGRPKLTFKCWFSWRQDTLLKMCEKGVMKPRIRVFMLGKERKKEQIDIVSWDEFRLNEDGMLTVVNIHAFDTAPLRNAAGQ